MAKEFLEELERPEYWDERYSKNDANAKAYGWLRHFSTIKPFLTKHLPPAEQKPRILHLGSGNSVYVLCQTKSHGCVALVLQMYGMRSYSIRLSKALDRRREPRGPLPPVSRFLVRRKR